MPDIDCFGKVGLPHLAERFKNAVTKDMSESEQREIGKKIANDYVKELHNNLNDLKKAIGKPETPFTPDDKSEAINAVKEDYQNKINEATPPPPKTPTTEEEAKKQDDEEWSSIRKEKLQEIKGAKKLFEQRVPKGWSEVYDSALKNVQDMYPKKSLYEAMKARVTDFVLRLNNKELFNPTSEDIAVFNVLKAETLKRIDDTEGQDSDNNIVRQAALMELDNYDKDLLDIARVTNPDGEAGRAFAMHQSEVNTNSGLKIRRMELMKANGGEKLSEADEAFVKEQWNKEKELMQQENEARTQQMQDDFNAKIADLQKQYEDKIKQAGKSKTSETKREKTLSQSGKDLADKIRKLKIQKGQTPLDVTIGLRNLAVEAVAQLVEQGAKLADAIKSVLTDDKYKGLSEDDLTNHIINGIDRQENKEVTFDKLKEFAKENDVTDITPDMVKDNLIRDFVNSHIGEVDQKELLDEATKSIKEILPNATKEKLIEAYLKENEFEQPTKRDLEGGLAEAKKQLQSIAKSTEDIADLEQLKEIRQRSFPTERERSEAEQELLDKKEALIKERKEREAAIRKENDALETERNRQLQKVKDLQDKKAKLQQGIIEKGDAKAKSVDTPEIEGLKKEVAQIEKDLRAAIAEKKAADEKVISNRNKKIKQDNAKIEAEAIRQVKKVQDLQDKKDKLENGIREKKIKQIPKEDVSEIEELKSQINDADKNLREAESQAVKMSKDIQAKKDKLDEMNAGIKRAEEGYDQIKTYKNTPEKNIDEDIAAKQKELKNSIKSNATDEQQQRKALADAIKNEEKKIKDFTQRIADGNYEEDAPPIKLKKESAELIRLAKQRSTIEETFRKKQHELQEKNKSWASKIANFIRSSYVMLLISKFGTLGKIATMAVTRPVSEGVRKMTLGKMFKAFFPNMSIAAERGGEGSSNVAVKKSFEAFFRQYGDKQMEAMYDRANNEFDAAQKAYEDYKNSDNPDKEKLKQLENKKNDALIKVQGSFIFKFIGGSSVKDALSALNYRANEIEKQFGHLEGESIKDGNALDKTSYVIGYLGRLHSALKTFSGRASFAAGFMSRLEGAVKLGEDISSPDKVLEIANESYLDWERGKYQQGNDISDLWNKWINNLTTGETGARLKVAKAAQFLLKFDVAITRVPVNILHEALVEYTFGLFKSAYITQKETGLFSYKVKNQLKSEGFNPDTPEFKEALKERISQMDSKQAATIARCFSKGGLGLGIYALTVITGAMHFGIFPHKGQKKKKGENELRADELNPGQVMIGDTKFGETASAIIEHTPLLYPSFMGLGLVRAYDDEIDKGRTTIQAAAKSLYTHLQIVEGSIPQSKLIEGLQEDAVKTVTKRMKDLGILDEPSIGKDKIKNYKKGGIPITDDEYKSFKDKKQEEYDKQVEKLKAGKLPENVVRDEKTGKVTTKKYADMTDAESKKALTSLKTKSGNKVKKEMFGEEDESSKERKQELKDAKAEAAENN